MKHASVRRAPEFVYGLLNLALLAAIGIVLVGGAGLLGALIQTTINTQTAPQRQKQIAVLTQSLAEHAGQPQKLYYDHIDRGDLLVKNNDFTLAAQDFETARALATTVSDRQYARLRLAKALVAGGHDGEALETLGVAIAAGRSADSEGYHERARLNSKLHKTDAALADFAATIALDPENLALRYERLGALTQAGRLGNASTALGELAHMATTGGTVRGLETEVGAAQNNDDLQGAIGTLTALIGLRPDDDRYYLWRSDLYLWTKQSDKAFADIDTAIRLNPYAMEARHRLGGAYDYVGQPARALSELDTAVTRDPDETAFRRTRGRVNFKLDHPTEAAADFQHAVELEGEPYSIIWLYLTRLKAGTPNLKELRTNMTSYTSRDAEQDPTQHWPYPIMRFLAGDIPESILLAAAEKPDDARRSREQRCEAVFYAGMNARLRGGRSQHGTALLTEARSLCPPGFVEFDVANWELRSAAR